MTRPSVGANESERAVYDLLCRVFTPVAVFANTIKDDGRELCDVMAWLTDRAFLVSVRDRKFNCDNDAGIEWARWSRETIGDKVKSLTKGARYLRSADNPVYLDSARTQLLPGWITRGGAPGEVHKLIVGFSVPEAVMDHKVGEEKTVRLQLMALHQHDTPFTFGVVKSEGEIVHVFNIEGLRLVASFADSPVELDEYLIWREEVVCERNVFFVNGEEDLIAAWMLKRFGHKPLVDPEQFRDEQGRLPAVAHIGTYGQFKRSALFSMKRLSQERCGFWNDLTDYVADGAYAKKYESPTHLAVYAQLLSMETTYLRAFTWHELKRKSREVADVVDVLVVSSMAPDLVYYFSVQDEEMSPEHRLMNVAFMSHAIAGQRRCTCLAVGVLPREPLCTPAIAFADTQGAPVIRRDMSSIAITIQDALCWLAKEAREISGL